MSPPLKLCCTHLKLGIMPRGPTLLHVFGQQHAFSRVIKCASTFITCHTLHDWPEPGRFARQGLRSQRRPQQPHGLVRNAIQPHEIERFQSGAPTFVLAAARPQNASCPLNTLQKWCTVLVELQSSAYHRAWLVTAKHRLNKSRRVSCYESGVGQGCRHRLRRLRRLEAHALE